MTTAVVVYGDEETLAHHRARVEEIAEGAELEVVSWHSDPTGLRGVQTPSDADGLVAALAECARREACLLLPFMADAPGEANWRLLSHWLHGRGLRLYVGGGEFCWHCAADPVDWALRRELDAASSLAAAVAATGATKSIDDLLEEIVGGDPVMPPPTSPSSGAALARARRYAEIDPSEEVPEEPDPGAPWAVRAAQCAEYARWLRRWANQAFVAEVFNALGVRTSSGGTWSRSSVSRLARYRAA